MTSLESKTRGDVYGNVKKSLMMILLLYHGWLRAANKCAAKRHKQKISNTELIDKEEAETDKSDHQK